MPVGGENFVLVLAEVAPEAALRGWIESAAPGQSVVYAAGVALPTETATVKLVQGWIARGLVTPKQRLCDGDERRFEFMAEKCGTPAEVDLVAEDRTARQKKRVLELLLQAAKQSRVCPSNSEIARQLGLSVTEAGRGRARYLVKLLEDDGAIRVATPRAFAARVVTIAKGPHAGAATKDVLERKRA